MLTISVALAMVGVIKFARQMLFLFVAAELIMISKVMGKRVYIITAL